MIAEGTSIDTTTGTEHIKWIELDTFSGSIAPFTNNQKGEQSSLRATLMAPASYTFRWTILDWILDARGPAWLYATSI